MGSGSLSPGLLLEQNFFINFTIGTNGHGNSENKWINALTRTRLSHLKIIQPFTLITFSLD